MLLLSRLQAEKMALSAWRFSIKDFMAELLSTHQYLFENKKVTLSKKLSDALVNKMMVTDKDKLQRILSELITNAVKYTPEGSVVVGAEEEGPKKIRFYVEDSGLGITEKDRAFIFQRFYRAEEVQRKAIRGTGLGLSIVNYLVELMGGTISVVSSPGKRVTLLTHDTRVGAY
ncbi:MAG: HAMP domain-containing sensor histidine kinase [Bacteroidales bacterium]|nr:HAMP domain-containing sensor histidine kinase [Bacteroidales bacterium]